MPITPSSFPVPLLLGVQSPLDARQVVNQVGDLVSTNIWGAGGNLFEGLMVYVTESQQTYVLTDYTQWDDANLAGWSLLGNQTNIPPAGPIGSVQYRYDTFSTSGSVNLLFISSSNTVTLNGAMKITGSFLQGFNNTVTGTWANAIGFGTLAQGNYSHAEGINTRAEAVGSHAEGSATKTVGLASGAHAEGAGTVVNAISAHAEGYASSASGDYSHAEGNSTKTLGDHSHTEGYRTRTTTAANYSHAEGYRTITEGPGAHAEGLYTSASGQFAHAEGSGSQAVGEWSHAEGRNAIANSRGTHAEGVNTYAGFVDGITNPSEGANYAHAEGNGTRAVGFASHAEGALTLASNQYAHAQGLTVTASGFASFAGGGSTRATSAFSTALGIKNLTTEGLLIIGNGTDEFNPGDANRSDLAVFKADQIILSQSIYLPDLDLVTSTTGKKFVIINPNTGFLEYSATGPAGSGGGGDITAVTAGNGLSGGGNDGAVTLALNTSSLHFGKGVSASAAFYGFGGGGTSNLDITNNTNNNIVTATGTNSLNGESNLTFNGSTLTVTGQVTATGITGSLHQVKAGSVPAGNFTGNPRIATVTVNMGTTNYRVSVIGQDARIWSIQNKTNSTFVINSNSSTALTQPVDWIVVRD
jgi:hypothetical protein